MLQDIMYTEVFLQLHFKIKDMKLGNEITCSYSSLLKTQYTRNMKAFTL